MDFHWQNLNKDGRELLHGHACWRFYQARKHYPHSKTVNVAWRLGAWQWIGLMFTRAAEEADYGLSLGFGFLQMYLELSGFRAYNAVPRCVFGLDTGIHLGRDYIVLKWDNDDSETSYSTDARGRRVKRDAHGWSYTLFFLDKLLGLHKHSSSTIDVSSGFITMPEATYSCLVRMHRDTWKRPRWPWAHTVERATVEVPRGIPIPGKGENSWDCGEDKIYSSTLPAHSAAEAMERLYVDACERRLKYGGRNWLPESVRQNAPSPKGDVS